MMQQQFPTPSGTGGGSQQPPGSYYHPAQGGYDYHRFQSSPQQQPPGPSARQSYHQQQPGRMAAGSSNPNQMGGGGYGGGGAGGLTQAMAGMSVAGGRNNTMFNPNAPVFKPSFQYNAGALPFAPPGSQQYAGAGDGGYGGSGNAYQQQQQQQQQQLNQYGGDQQQFYSQQQPPQQNYYDSNAAYYGGGQQHAFGGASDYAAGASSTTNSYGYGEGYNFNESYDSEASSPQIGLSADLYTAIMSSPNAAILSEIQVGLEQLAAEADEFDIWSVAVRDRMGDKALNDEDLKTIAALVIEMAVITLQSQYTYSRMCVMMCDRYGDKFRNDCLLAKLRETHENRIALDQQMLQNLSIFLAELFTRLTTSQGSRIEVLGMAIFEEVDSLLRDPVLESNVKSVIQILKCCGSGLDELKDGRHKLDEALLRLLAVKDGDNIKENLKRAITSLIDLRSNHWGMKEGGSGTAPSQGTKPRGGPLYVGPDGQPLSAEESAFLEENIGGGVDSTNSEDEPDAEMMAAYEDFLSSQQKK